MYLHLINNSTSHKTPEETLPLSKAGPRKTGHTRRKIKSAILTHTPGKERLELEHAAKTMKQKTTSKVSVTAKKPEPLEEEHLPDHLLESEEVSPDDDELEQLSAPCRDDINVKTLVLVTY